jgi:hypothetical protein
LAKIHNWLIIKTENKEKECFLGDWGEKIGRDIFDGLY